MALGRILHLERSSGTFRSIFPSLCYLISVNMPKGGGGGFYAVRKGTVPGVYLTWYASPETLSISSIIAHFCLLN